MSCGGVDLLTPALLLRQERGHQARADHGFRMWTKAGRDAGDCRILTALRA